MLGAFDFQQRETEKDKVARGLRGLRGLRGFASLGVESAPSIT